MQAQIRIAQGYKLSDPEIGIASQEDIQQRGVAIQVRVTAEDPRNDFMPDTGKITVYRPAVGIGIRLDDGSGYVGARVSQFYDSLLAKITASGPRVELRRGARSIRALREFRIRGVKTNLAFLENVLTHPTFAAGKAHTTFIDETPELMQYAARRDRATRILRYVGVDDRQRPPDGARQAQAADVGAVASSRRRRRCRGRPPPPGTKQVLEKEGPAGIVKMLRKDKRVRSPTPPGATRTSRCWPRGCARYDIARVAPATAHLGANLFSLEMWGGATFDVAYRFLSEDPWLRLEELRRLVPNVMFQMLVRGANAVGYTNYPDDVVSGFIEEAAAAGMDVFRIFDALNDVDNMQVGDRGGAEERAHRRDVDLLHGRRLRSAAQEVRPQVLRRPGQGHRPPRHAPAGDQGHGRPAQAARRDDAGQGAEGRGRRAAAPAHARHLGQQHRDVPGGDRGGRRRHRRRGQQHGRHDVAAVAVVAGVRARRLAARSRASNPTTSSSCRPTGSRCARSTRRSSRG